MDEKYVHLSRFITSNSCIYSPFFLQCQLSVTLSSYLFTNTCSIFLHSLPPHVSVFVCIFLLPFGVFCFVCLLDFLLLVYQLVFNCSLSHQLVFCVLLLGLKSETQHFSLFAFKILTLDLQLHENMKPYQTHALSDCFIRTLFC